MKSFDYFDKMSTSLENSEIQEWKKQGKIVVGTLCSNIPEEILHSAGLLPVRVRAPGLQDTSSADARLHQINCSYTRSVLELFMNGKLDFMDGLIVTNTCDHHLRLAGELMEKPNFPVHCFQMYHTRSDSAKEWFIMEINRMINYIKKSFDVNISENDLNHSIDVYNRTRRLMSIVNKLREKDPPALSGTEYMKIVITGMTVPRERFNGSLEELISAFDRGKPAGPQKPRVMVIGGACDSYEFINTIESSGAWVVADGLCFGIRHYNGLIDRDSKDPIKAIADRYFNRAACPAVMDAFDYSHQILLNSIKNNGIQGVIGARLKYCDHWAGACKMMRDALKDNTKIPLLELEREYGTTGSGQISTRLQAFFEMLAD